MPDTTLQIECLTANAVGTPKLYLYNPATLLAFGNVAGYGISSSISLLRRFVVPEADAVTGEVYGEVRDDEKVLAYGWANATAGQTKHLAPALESATTSLSAADLSTIEGYNTAARDAVIARGDTAWITATGFSTLDAAGVRAAVGLASANLDTQLAAIVEDTGTTIPALLPANFAALGINVSGHLSRVTLVDTTTTNSDMRGTDGASTLTTADIDARLAAYDGPTHAELTAAFTEIKGATWSSVTDTLEAIRDRGDVAWVTATGFSTLDAAGVRAAVGLASANLDTQLAAIVEDTGTTLPAMFPANFASLGINASGHVSRVVLVDTTTANTDMRGTDGAYTGTPPTAAAIADAVWDELQSEHVTVGSFGYYLDARVSTVSSGGSSGPTASEIADAVWDELRSGHAVAGSYGETLTTVHSNIGNLDAAVSSRSSHTAADVWTNATRTLTAFGFGVTVDTNNDKTGYSLTQAFPANFASLGINASGHVSRVTLVDTTTANTDMRGTDGALLAASAPANFSDLTIAATTGTVTAGNMRGTDNALLASSAPANFSVLAITTGGAVTVGTNNDKAGYSLSGTITTLDALTTELSSTHGAGSWATATGFAVPGDTMLVDMTQATPGLSTVGARLDAAGTGGLTAGEAAQLLAVYNLTETSGGTETLNTTAVLEIAEAVNVGAGQYRIRVTVSDSTTAALISGAFVTLLTDQGVATNSAGYTNVSGYIDLPANDGSYLIQVTAPSGYETPANVAVTVNGADTVASVQLAARFIAPAVAPELCAVVFDVIDELGDPYKGAKVTAALKNTPSMAGDALVANAYRSGRTDDTGRVTLELIRAAQFNYGDGVYEITVETRRGTHKFDYSVPNSATAIATALTDA